MSDPLNALETWAEPLLAQMSAGQRRTLATTIGRELRIGAAVLRVTDHIGRCDATGADTATGRRDIDMVRMLESLYGHTDFGIFAEVVTGGPIRLQDQVHA